MLTVSTLHPISPEKTMNMVEFYYPEEIVAFEREFVEQHRANVDKLGSQLGSMDFYCPPSER